MKKVVTLLIVLCLFIGLYIGIGYFRTIYGKGALNITNEVTLEDDAGFTQTVNAILDYSNISFLKQHYIKHYFSKNNIDTKIKPGNYTFSSDASVKSIAETLLYGPIKDEIQLTFIEGWDRGNYIEYVQNSELSYSDNFESVINNKNNFSSEQYPLIAEIPHDVNHLEGYLFPETYSFYNNATSIDIVERLLGTLEKKVTPEMREDIRKQGKSFYDILIMASVLEKEVRQYETKQMVADIFWKRIDIGMPLQSDATVNYITRKGTDRPSLDDLEVDSLYNTYQHTGLPPTPIANPGLDSIMAAIYPTSNDYYFFLTTREGNIYYAKNHDQHVANKRAYLD